MTDTEAPTRVGAVAPVAAAAEPGAVAAEPGAVAAEPGAVAAEPGAVAALPGLRPSDPAHDAIAASLARNVAKLVRHSTGVRNDVPGSVRKLRIAARRLRSDLYTFRPLLDEEWARGLGVELKALAHGLGAGRDREVTLLRLERDVTALPAGAPAEATLAFLRHLLSTELDQARDDSQATVATERTARLLAAMQAAAQDPRTTAEADRSCRDALPPLVAAAYRKLAKRAKELRLDAPGTVVHADADDAWHAARILAKRARYAADACVPVFGEPSEHLALRLAEVTRCLGEHQDAALAAGAAVELGSRVDVPAAAALGLGLLHGVQREAVLAARAIFVEDWPDIRKFASAHRRLTE